MFWIGKSTDTITKLMSRKLFQPTILDAILTAESMAISYGGDWIVVTIAQIYRTQGDK